MSPNNIVSKCFEFRQSTIFAWLMAISRFERRDAKRAEEEGASFFLPGTVPACV